MRERVAAVLGLLLLAAGGEGAGPRQDGRPWFRAATPRFEVVAEASPEAAAGVARQLEAFRTIVEAALPPGVVPAPQPTLAVAFATDSSFSAHLPGRAGQPARVAAFVALDESAPCLAFHLERKDRSLGPVLHEYARVILRRTPLWFMEGAAEVYGGAAATEDGRALRVGKPIALNVSILRASVVPLADLLTAARAPAGTPGQAFYAGSWALAHYLLLGHEAHAGQVPAFLARVAAGAPIVQAFEEAFGAIAEVERELRRYIERGAWAVKEHPLPDAPPTVPVSHADVDAALGRLLLQAGRDADAESRLQRALAANPSHAGAQLAMGVLRLGQDRVPEAIERLGRARSLAPESLPAAYHFARASLRAPGPVVDERLEEAHAALAKLVTPGVRFADAWSVLGMLSGRLGRLEEAERALRTALDLAPGRLQAVAELADVLALLERFDEAERLLDSVREAAARGGADLEPWRERVTSEREIARIRGDLSRAAAGARAAEPPPAKRTGRWLVAPDYRPMGAGEERTHGRLRRIDCEAGRVVVQVATAEGPLRFTAGSLAAIQAISYREGLEPLLACGPRHDLEPVFVTWRPSSGPGSASFRGAMVALEFLGAEYLPR